jgi:hypothetical protein
MSGFEHDAASIIQLGGVMRFSGLFTSGEWPYFGQYRAAQSMMAI